MSKENELVRMVMFAGDRINSSGFYIPRRCVFIELTIDTFYGNMRTFLDDSDLIAIKFKDGTRFIIKGEWEI